MKPVYLFGNLNLLPYKNDSFAITNVRTTIKFTEPNWNWVY